MLVIFFSASVSLLLYNLYYYIHSLLNTNRNVTYYVHTRGYDLTQRAIQTELFRSLEGEEAEKSENEIKLYIFFLQNVRIEMKTKKKEEYQSDPKKLANAFFKTAIRTHHIVTCKKDWYYRPDQLSPN